VLPPHATPQAPQFCASLASVTSHPSPLLPLQFARPAKHTRPVHAPATQLALFTPGSVAQLLLQPLQFVTEVVMFTSHPSAVIPLQFAKPGRHAAMPQVPPLQVCVALARAHALPQPPQCATLEKMSTQAPLQLLSPPAQVVTQALFEHT
jgi:hypothetical protein